MVKIGKHVDELHVEGLEATDVGVLVDPDTKRVSVFLVARDKATIIANLEPSEARVLAINVLEMADEVEGIEPS